MFFSQTKVIKPTIDLDKTYRDFVDSAKPLISAAVQAEMKTFNAAVSQLSRKLARPSYKFSNSLRKERDSLAQEIASKHYQYESKFLSNEKTTNALNDEFSRNHILINELNGKSSVEEAKLLAKSEQVALKIADKEQQKKDTIDEQGCCTRYIFCCFTPSNIKNDTNEIATLDKEQEKLSSSDPTREDMSECAKLITENKEVSLLLTKQNDTQPQEDIQDLIVKHEQVIEKIAEGQLRHYSEVSEETMFHVVRTKILFEAILNKLTDNRITTTPKSRHPKTPLLTQDDKLLSLMTEKNAELESSFNQLVCPTQNNLSANDFKRIFLALDDGTQKTYLAASQITPEMIAKIIPTTSVKCVM